MKIWTLKYSASMIIVRIYSQTSLGSRYSTKFLAFFKLNSFVVQ